MPFSKELARIEAKLDALLEKSGLKPDEIVEPMSTASRPAHKLTKQEQQAIDNAPATPVAAPPASKGPRVTATNAPDTSSSVPAVPSDAVGNVTVETKQPSGNVSVDTMPASRTKGKS